MWFFFSDGMIHRHWGYVHTVLDRFLPRFKSCSGTVWTRINVPLRCKNCSEASSVWTEALSVIQFATLLLIWKDCLPKRGSVAISAPIKVFRLDSDRFHVPLSTAEWSSNVPEQKLLWKQRSQCDQKPYPVHSVRLSGSLCGTVWT